MLSAEHQRQIVQHMPAPVQLGALVAALVIIAVPVGVVIDAVRVGQTEAGGKLQRVASIIQRRQPGDLARVLHVRRIGGKVDIQLAVDIAAGPAQREARRQRHPPLA